MDLKINGVDIAAKPKEFTVTVMDLDDGEATTRTANGTLNRDRIAVKRQIDMTFPALPMEKISALLKSMRNAFFDFYYPDPMDGAYVTRKMYVGNRPAPMAIERNGVTLWAGLQITLTER